MRKLPNFEIVMWTISRFLKKTKVKVISYMVGTKQNVALVSTDTCYLSMIHYWGYHGRKKYDLHSYFLHF